MLRIFAVSMAICLYSGSSYATETAIEAMRTFGLFGIWSEDCTADLSREDGFRDKFTAPAAGPPKRITVMTVTAGGRMSRPFTTEDEAEITSATRITQDKLKITVVDTTRKLTTDMVYMKEGNNKLRLLHVFQPDQGQYSIKDGMLYEWNKDLQRNVGTNIRTPILEKCLGD